MFSHRFRWSLETNRVARLLVEKQQTGAALLDLTESNPTRAGLDYPAETLDALADPASLRYEPAPRGLVRAREAVCDYYRALSLEASVERVHLTASTSEGYAYLFKLLCDSGDRVLVPQPSYPLFEFLAALEGVELRPYPLEYLHPRGWRIDLPALVSAIDDRTRAVIVVNPNNPTGSLCAGEERRELDRICAERGLSLIVDEVFIDYLWGEEAPGRYSFVEAGEALTFVLSGLSKVVALPQMKLGWIVSGGPADLHREAIERLDLIADTFLSVSTPVQHAARRWLEMRAGVQGQIRGRVRANLAHLRGLVEGTSCRLLSAQGGWYATLEIPRREPEEELVLKLLGEDDVLVHPGYFFDFPREAFLVLSLLAPESVFEEGVRRVLARVA